MPNDHEQFEFLLCGTATGAPELADPLGDLRERIAECWNVPLGQRVKMDLRDCNVPWLEGRLVLSRAPDLPLDARQSLALRIGTVEFSHRQIVAWALAER